MDERYIEQYILNDSQLRDDMWKDCIFIFDTNVLLNLYIYSLDTRKIFLKALSCIKNRLQFTSQSIIEFHKNRLVKIIRQREAFEEIEKKFNSSINAIKKSSQETNNCFDSLKSMFKNFEINYNNFDEEKSLLDGLLDSYRKKIDDALGKAKESIPNYTNDEILNTLYPLFKENLIEPFSPEEMSNIEIEGDNRYKNKIPPGYEDEKDKSENKYGDLFIWKEMIKLSKSEKKPILFITDERKKDWWTLAKKDKGGLLYPRLELVKELYTETGQYFWIYTSSNFLKEVPSLCEEIQEGDLDKAIIEVKQAQEMTTLIGEFLLVWKSLEQEIRAVANSNKNIKHEHETEGFLSIPIHKAITILTRFEILNGQFLEQFHCLKIFRNSLVHEDILLTIEKLTANICLAEELLSILKNIDRPDEDDLSS